MKQLIENPFPTINYAGPDYFCDRKEETSRLLKNIKSGKSTTITAIRRIGKTGLIKHVLGQLPKGFKGIYVDILETENINHFLNLLTTAVINAVPERSGMGKKIWTFIRSLRPVITFDKLSGAPQASFDIKVSESESNIYSVLQFLEKQDFKIVIAIDEFQQILNYPEKNTDAWLRTRIQQLRNVVFIFSGSQQHLMNELFASPKRPFFRSTEMLKLEKIKQEEYAKFIIGLFGKYHKNISRETTTDILNWADTHTFYVQQIFNRIFAIAKDDVTPDVWKNEAFLLLKEQETLFLNYRNLLTNPQWQLLKAIASEGKVFMPTAKAFLNKYQLGTSATVLKSLRSLIDDALIYYEYDRAGEKYYGVYDVWFHRWCEGR